MKALVVNYSTDYNLGVEKICNWLKRSGHQVVKAGPGKKNFKEFDIIYLSALYTWELPILIEQAKQASLHTQVEIGGPAASVMTNYILDQTGIKPQFGFDNRFDLQDGKYHSTYTSRGCIRNCEFCSVPLVEGKLREISDFIPAPIVLDPNFLACSKNHIEKVCEKLARLPYVDFLHGLDARLLEPWHIELFLKQLNILCWRFTLDSVKNESTLKNILVMLKNYGIKPQEKVIVYCIYGFSDTPTDAWERARLIMTQLAHPYAMRYQPLDTQKKDSYISKNWDNKKLVEFNRLCNIPTIQWLNNLLRSARKTSGR